MIMTIIVSASIIIIIIIITIASTQFVDALRLVRNKLFDQLLISKNRLFDYFYKQILLQGNVSCFFVCVAQKKSYRKSLIG